MSGRELFPTARAVGKALGIDAARVREHYAKGKLPATRELSRAWLTTWAAIEQEVTRRALEDAAKLRGDRQAVPASDAPFLRKVAR